MFPLAQVMDKAKKVLEGKPKLRERLEEIARESGFRAIGVARADAAPRSAARLAQWLAAGAHGDMIWMEETAARRGTPRACGRVSVISLGMSYAPEATRWRSRSDAAGSRSMHRAATITT